MDLKKLSLEAQILAVAGLVLIIDLLFLPWHRMSISIPGVLTVSENRSAIESPNGFLGLLALLLAAAVVGRLIVANFTTMKLPELPMSWVRAQLFASGAVAGLLVLKLIVETDFLGIGAWLGILAAGGMVYTAFRLDRQAPVALQRDVPPLNSIFDFGPQPNSSQIAAYPAPSPAPAPMPEGDTEGTFPA
ncbi:MAG: hypothetical protein ACRDZ3_08260 [Acidimicrobiia bacterium]